MDERKEMIDNQVRATIGDFLLDINIDDEESSRLDPEQIQVYTKRNKELVEATVAVRQQPLFGDFQIEEVYYQRAGDVYKEWKPYKYQKENVKTMLNRFEGRGVFGDQVGLGKTIEALIAIHVMFRSGAIHNATIITPRKLCAQWKGEIENKFYTLSKGKYLPIFKVTECKLDELAGLLEKHEKNELYHIYLINANTIEPDDLGRAMDRKKKYREAESIFTDVELMGISFEKTDISIEYTILGEPKGIRIGQLYKEIEDLERVSLQNLRKIIEEKFTHIETQETLEKPIYECVKKQNVRDFFGRHVIEQELIQSIICSEDGYVRVNGRRRSIDNPFVRAAIEAAKKQYVERSVSAASSKKKLEENRQTVMRVEEKILQARRLTEDKIARSAALLKLTEEPLLDLLVVDEIHKFYEKNDTKSKRDTMRNILAAIKKKYCLLLSATPINDSLNDVVDLLYLLGQTGYGGSYETLKSYFYRVFCGLDEDASLADLASNPDSLKRLKGMINSIFTRKRRARVVEDFKVVEKHGFYVDAKSCKKIEAKGGIAASLAQCLAEGRGALADYLLDIYDKKEDAHLANFINAPSSTGAKILIYFSSLTERKKFVAELTTMGRFRKGKLVNEFFFTSGDFINECKLLTKVEVEGLNLQEYNIIIFGQMTTAYNNLLSPEKIEQWIGRIYRLQQENTCYVLTFGRALDIDTGGELKKFDSEFIDFYYDLLNDAEGLDLYRNGCADVAFVTPLVTTYLHKVAALKKGNVYPDLKGNSEIPKIMRVEEGDTFKGRINFPQMVKYFYDHKQDFYMYKAFATGSRRQGQLDTEGIKEIVRYFCRVLSE